MSQKNQVLLLTKQKSLLQIFFHLEGIPHFIVLAILCILCVFLDPVCAKVWENIARTMVIHYVNVESMFCSEIFAFITTFTLAVTRFNWAEWAEWVRRHIPQSPVDNDEFYVSLS